MKAIFFPHFLVVLIALVLTPAAAEENSPPVTIVALGTSLTAGFGLPSEEGFTEVLARSLAAKGQHVIIENAGVSGDTSAGGLARLDWALSPTTQAVIVELGSNDALRGLNPTDTEKNLRGILDKLKERELPVLLAGMLAPPNLGPEYAAEFEPIFAKLAEEYETVFYPFFLDGVAAEAALNQPDGIHPNADGVSIIVERITPTVLSMLDKIQLETDTELSTAE